jgi:hypothetical protein
MACSERGKGGDMMITRKHLLLAIAATCLLTMFVITIVPIRSQTAGQYDPWLDINGDGAIDGGDIIQVARAFGTAGDPTRDVNVTNWPTSLFSSGTGLNQSMGSAIVAGGEHWFTQSVVLMYHKSFYLYVQFSTGSSSNPLVYLWWKTGGIELMDSICPIISTAPGGWILGPYDVKGPEMRVSIANIAVNGMFVEVALYGIP